MRKCSSTILYAACTFRPYKSTPVLKLFRTFTGKMTRGLSLRMVFSLLFQDTLLWSLMALTKKAQAQGDHPCVLLQKLMHHRVSVLITEILLLNSLSKKQGQCPISSLISIQ